MEVDDTTHISYGKRFQQQSKKEATLTLSILSRLFILDVNFSFCVHHIESWLRSAQSCEVKEGHVA